MNKPGFFEGVVVALVISAVASIMFSVLSSVFSAAWLMKLLVALMGMAYIIYLLIRSEEKVGRITVMMLWISGAGIIWLVSPPFLLYVVLHMGMIWFIRSLYYYSSIASSIGDLGLNLVSTMISVWAGLHTNSLFLSLWCFFLLQALFVFIPASLRNSGKTTSLSSNLEDRFEQAYRSAETAVRKLTSI